MCIVQLGKTKLKFTYFTFCSSFYFSDFIIFEAGEASGPPPQDQMKRDKLFNAAI